MKKETELRAYYLFTIKYKNDFDRFIIFEKELTIEELAENIEDELLEDNMNKCRYNDDRDDDYYGRSEIENLNKEFYGVKENDPYDIIMAKILIKEELVKTKNNIYKLSLVWFGEVFQIDHW